MGTGGTGGTEEHEGTGRRTLRHVVVLVVLAASLAGCGAAVYPSLAGERADGLPVGETLVRSELVFGRARPDGSTVSEGEWQGFVDAHVTPRFPEGLTMIDAAGQYRTRAGLLVRESSKILVLLHQGSDRQRSAIEDIRAIYKRLFDQEAVLLITTLARVAF